MTNSDTEVRRLDFGGLSIAYDGRVLTPRPWTTAQSYWAADLLRQAPPGPVLELCSGVGHIGLLAVVGTDRPLVLVDADGGACALARENARAALPDGTWEVREGRVDQVLSAAERFAGIIADPPWVRSHDTGRFPEDPLSAIDGGPEGMDVAWACLAVASSHLVERGWLLLQLGTVDQARAVQERLDTDAEHVLRHVETREYGERGVLLHLART